MTNKEPSSIVQSNSQVRQGRTLIPWLWEGVVAMEAITLLSAPTKTGKSTLLSLLLDRRRAGGELLGRSVYPGKTILCSEENTQIWAQRQPPLDFGPDLLFSRPMTDVPTSRSWKRYVNNLCELIFPEYPYDLVVIDTAIRFLPLAHRNARLLQAALAELRLLADFPGVLLLNQDRTVQRPLAALADIVINMSIPRSGGVPRRRHFQGAGRYPGTLETATADLNPEGTDYLLAREGPAAQPAQPALLPLVLKLLGDSPAPLTREELLARWPGTAPHPDSLSRTFARGIDCGLFTTTGTGVKGDPYRITLASKMTPPEPAA